MNFGQTKKALKRLVDRPDMTDAQAAEFVQRAISSLERSPLRLGFQKTLIQATFDGSSNSIQIPGNYLELIDLFEDTRTYSSVVTGTFIKTSQHTDRPVYTTMGQTFLLKPTPAAGTDVHLHYYAEAPAVTVDTDENTWLKSAFEAVLYTAATMAADDYQIEDRPNFAAQAAIEIQKLQDQDSSEEWAGDLSIELPIPNIC